MQHDVFKSGYGLDLRLNFKVDLFRSNYTFLIRCESTRERRWVGENYPPFLYGVVCYCLKAISNLSTIFIGALLAWGEIWRHITGRTGYGLSFAFFVPLSYSRNRFRGDVIVQPPAWRGNPGVPAGRGLCVAFWLLWYVKHKLANELPALLTLICQGNATSGDVGTQAQIIFIYKMEDMCTQRVSVQGLYQNRQFNDWLTNMIRIRKHKLHQVSFKSCDH